MTTRQINIIILSLKEYMIFNQKEIQGQGDSNADITYIGFAQSNISTVQDLCAKLQSNDYCIKFFQNNEKRFMIYLDEVDLRTLFNIVLSKLDNRYYVTQKRSWTSRIRAAATS